MLSRQRKASRGMGQTWRSAWFSHASDLEVGYPRPATLITTKTNTVMINTGLGGNTFMDDDLEVAGRSWRPSTEA